MQITARIPPSVFSVMLAQLRIPSMEANLIPQGITINHQERSMKLFRNIFHLKNLSPDSGERSWKSDCSSFENPAMTMENICREHNIPVSGTVCHITTASGAKWTCHSEGYARLIESNGLPFDSAIEELLNYLGLPTVFMSSDMKEEFSVARLLVHSAIFNGCVFIGELQKAYYGAADACRACRINQVSREHKGDAEEKNSEEARANSSILFTSAKQAL